MKKALILTCSTGEGHNSAARAVETALLREGFECTLADPVSFQSERVQKMVSSLYNETIRKVPGIFGAVYKLGDLYSSTKLPSPVYWANAHYSDALKQYILENHFDAVICTHLYGMEAMTAIRRDEDFSIPCFGVLTDYVSIPFLHETDLNEYFVPSEEVRDFLTGRGISEAKIIVSGIPVNAIFREHPDKTEARKKLEIPEEKKVFLVMTGGVGCENMEQLCRKLFDSLQQEDMMLVLTGKNEELKKRLDEKYGSSCRLRTVPFTSEVAAYMAASDVLLSKPGGLSSTEAAVANIPLVHIHGIPGCETYNARFFAEHGMSMKADNDEQAITFARELAYDPEKSEKMRQMQRTYVNPDAAGVIVREVGEKWLNKNL